MSATFFLERSLCNGEQRALSRPLTVCLAAIPRPLVDNGVTAERFGHCPTNGCKGARPPRDPRPCCVHSSPYCSPSLLPAVVL